MWRNREKTNKWMLRRYETMRSITKNVNRSSLSRFISLIKAEKVTLTKSNNYAGRRFNHVWDWSTIAKKFRIARLTSYFSYTLRSYINFFLNISLLCWGTKSKLINGFYWKLKILIRVFEKKIFLKIIFHRNKNSFWILSQILKAFGSFLLEYIETPIVFFQSFNRNFLKK